MGAAAGGSRSSITPAFEAELLWLGKGTSRQAHPDWCTLGADRISEAGRPPLRGRTFAGSPVGCAGGTS